MKLIQTENSYFSIMGKSPIYLFLNLLQKKNTCIKVKNLLENGLHIYDLRAYAHWKGFVTVCSSSVSYCHSGSKPQHKCSGEVCTLWGLCSYLISFLLKNTCQWYTWDLWHHIWKLLQEKDSWFILHTLLDSYIKFSFQRWWLALRGLLEINRKLGLLWHLFFLLNLNFTGNT